jgi:hypothetical protein
MLSIAALSKSAVPCLALSAANPGRPTKTIQTMAIMGITVQRDGLSSLMAVLLLPVPVVFPISGKPAQQ